MGILDMINANTVLRVRLIVYGALIFFSFFIFVGVAVMKDKTSSSCALYCDRIPTAVSKLNLLDCGSSSNCNYPMAISIMFQLMYLVFRIATLVLLMIGKLGSDMFLFSDILELVYTAVDLVVFFLTFIGACILSAGTNYTCGEFFDCEYNEGFKQFLSASRAAQAGAWISTFLWLGVGILGFLYLLRAGKLPFIGGGAAPSSGAAGATGTGDAGPPPQDIPSNNPDDAPKY